MKIEKISEKALESIKAHEGLRLKAYLCQAGVPTIGWGTTIYPNGSKIKLGDEITKDDALKLLKHDVIRFEKAVDAMTTDKVNQNQFDALVSFAYNLGTEALRKSTLLKVVNANPNDQRIKKEFQKWVYADGKKSGGLIKRRQDEANLYFS
jgi:lysozyme